jgi:hypothetical protein
MSTGIAIDLLALDSEQESKILTAVRALSEYIDERKEVAESEKITIEQLIADLQADKDSAKEIKKHVKKTAKHYNKRDKDRVQNDNAVVEALLDKLDRNLVD